MSIGKFFSAAFKTRNFILLTIILVVFLATFNIPVGVAGFIVYLSFVVQTLMSKGFKREYHNTENLSRIHKLNWECGSLYNSVRKNLDRSVRAKIDSILKEKDVLMRFFNDNNDDPLRRQIMEQALKLVSAYIQLTYNYHTRIKEISTSSLSRIEDRINKNNRKLGALKNYNAVLDLTRVIEMDEALLMRLKEEKSELERVNVKLDYIESTIGAFRHRIMSNDCSDPQVEEIESVVNEATALDNVLNNHRKNRLNL